MKRARNWEQVTGEEMRVLDLAGYYELPPLRPDGTVDFEELAAELILEGDQNQRARDFYSFVPNHLRRKQL